MKLAFLGDISLNNRFEKLYTVGNDPFRNISHILKDCDLVIGNLESPAAGVEENILKMPRLKTKVETLGFLKNINLGLALLANNHIYDSLEEGFERTNSKLREMGINYIGAGFSNEESAKPFVFENDGLKICLMNYVTKDTNPGLPKNSRVHLNIFDKELSFSEISKISKNYDMVILCMHWGGEVENFGYPDQEQRDIALKAIKSGADLIIGHHSHTVQPKEIFDNVNVYYSLGNFCFDDVIIDSLRTKEIERGKGTESLIVIVEISSNKEVKIKDIPIDKMDFEIFVDSNLTEKFKKRQRIYEVIKSNKMLWKIVKLKNDYFDKLMFYFFGNDHNYLKQLQKLNFRKLRNYLLR